MKKLLVISICVSLLILMNASGIPKAKAAYEYQLEFEWGSDESDNSLVALRDEHPSDSATCVSAAGVGFKTTSEFYLGYIDLRLKRVGDPTSYLVGGLYHVSAGLPTGNAIAYSALIDSSTISTSTVWFSINFSASCCILTNDTDYIITLEANTSNVDSSNYISIYGTTNNTDTYSRVIFRNSAWSVASDLYDSSFRVYSMIGTWYSLECYHTNGGIFRANNTTVTNGSKIEYFLVGFTIIEFAALPMNSSYKFVNYTWDTGNSTINPYDYTLSQNQTLWIYFKAVGPSFLVLAVVASFILIPVIFLIAIGIRRKV